MTPLESSNDLRADTNDSFTVPDLSFKRTPEQRTHDPLGEHSGFSLIMLLNLMLRARRLLAITTGIGVVFALLSSIFIRQYRATSVFMPQTTQREVSTLAGIAAQFGIPFGSDGSPENVIFYAALPTSREILRQLAITEFRFTRGAHPQDTIQGTLVQLLKAEGETPTERVNATIDALRDRVAASPDLKSGLVTIEVTAPFPELAELMNRRILDLVAEFNLKRRQSQAGAERRFVEQRLRDARAALDSAETALEHFLSENRRYQESPRLALVAAQLQRRIDLRQQVYISLAKAYEDARLQEVRDTPVITIIDPPENSARRAGAGLILSMFLGIFVGGVFGTAIALMGDAFARQRDASPGEYAELLRLWRATFGRVLRRQRAH